MRLLAVCVIALIAFAAFASALTIPIDANREECVYEDVDVSQKVTVSYQVFVLVFCALMECPKLSLR